MLFGIITPGLLNFLRPLLVLIILEYKMFKSVMIFFPSSNLNIGLKFGGRTGKYLINNQLGLNFVCTK